MKVQDQTTSGTGVSPVCASLLTSFTPGAIAIIQLTGDDYPLNESLEKLTGKNDWPVNSMRLAQFIDSNGAIDTGLVARLTPEIVHLMPHGGPRVVQRIMARCAEAGIVIQRADAVQPKALFPESEDEVEAMMLSTLARARSPLAVDLLLDQSRRWRQQTISPPSEGGAGEGERPDVHIFNSAQKLTEQDLARSARLNRLIDPALVVLAGPANVGKSTLSNKLLGRSMSIAVDQPGTTRDYITGHVELAGLVVLWHDTPGLRETDDPIEREAIALAGELMFRADYLIAMTDHKNDWPKLRRVPDLKVANKCDLGRRGDAQVSISAVTGEGLEALVRTIRDAMVPVEDLRDERPWLFDNRLIDREATG